MSEFNQDQIREQLARGVFTPEESGRPLREERFRLKVTGIGSTKWLNVTRGELTEIAAVLGSPSPLQRIADILAEDNWSVGMLEDIAAIVSGAGVEPRADREAYQHH